VSNQSCTRCGRPLVAGACPLGHPQRSVRRRRRRWKLPLLLVVVAAILAAGAYAALIWYPLREAEEAMVPASRDFAATIEPLERTVEAFPENGDPALLGEAAGVLDHADDARARLTEAQVRLEDEAPPNLPVLSQRTPLRLARETHDDLEEFHVAALELVGRLEASARYLTQLAPTLTTLDNLETALGDPESLAQIQGAVASGAPIADQLTADVRALSPPDEVGAVHASLTAIVRGIRSAIEDLGELTTEAEAPVAQAILEDIRSQRESFRETTADAADAARAGGLGERIASVEALARAIVVRLEQLQAEGVEGLTIPQI
jgi:hypothetical protein